MGLCALLALVFLELHGPTGQVLELNPAEISSLREPLDLTLGHRHWVKGTNCVVVMTNGGFIGVTEDCSTVVHKLGEIK